jgi:aspartyl-tRNA(Asn)/glutamyl-tRNA(Gln) amidotransferase subunit A
LAVLPETLSQLPAILTATAALRQMEAGTLSAVEVVENNLRAIAAREGELNAFVYVAPAEQLLAEASQLDAERRQGGLRGSLHGVTVAVKDLIAVTGMLNTASSRMLAGERASGDAGSVRLLRDAGAIIIGKTHTHEFALGVVTPQSRNPWNVTRDPGGSSGGSAIAVATGMALVALGTDTRASSRVPTSLCGGVGFKATFGLIPSDGIITLSWSLDHVAPMTADVADAALLLTVLTNKSTGIDYTRFLNRDIARLRVGVPLAACVEVDDGVMAAFRRGVDALVACGVTVEEIDTPDADDLRLSMLMGLIVSRCEAAAFHRTFAGREHLYTTPVYEQIDEANQVRAVDYIQAQRWREEFRSRMRQLLRCYDGLLMPTTSVTAPKSTDVDKYFLTLSRNCIPWSFIGFPACSLPCSRSAEGLPVGAQLVTAPLEDGLMVVLAAALERNVGDWR